MKNKRLFALLVTLALVVGISASDLSSTAQASGGHIHNQGKLAEMVGHTVQSDRVVVEGQGDPSVDIAAVQDAIDTLGAAGGGTVVLEGDFDFGAYGRVTIPYDNITLKGTKQGHTHKTTIKGGAFPVLIGQDLRVANYDFLDKAEIPIQDGMTYLGSPETVVPVHNVVVKDLHFEDPYLCGISITGSNGNIGVTGNRFTDGRPINDFWDFDYMVKAIAVLSGYYWEPSFITGHISIKDNDIDGRYRMDPDDPDAKYVGEPGEGYYLRGLDMGILAVAANATFTIGGNSITNVAEYGVFVSGEYGGSMSATLRDNRIDNGYIGVAAIPTNENLIESGIYVSVVPGATVDCNTISVEHPRGEGIVTWGNEAVAITDNKVHTEDATAAILIADDVYDSTVSDNSITGSGHTGIWLGWPYYANENNTIVDNSLNGFTPTSGHDPFGIGASWGAHIGLYWGARNNTLRNNKFSVVDPDDDDLCNVYFAGPFGDVGLPGATQNELRAKKNTKVWDGTSDYNPYDPDTYNGDNDIQLGEDH